MRICHVTSVHPAKDARIFYKECASLVKRYEVYLIAPNVDDECDKGVNIVGVSLPKSRTMRLLSLKNVYQKALEVNADLYHFHDPELMRIGAKLARKGKRVVFDSHEDIPQQILTKDYLPNWVKTPFSKVYAAIERHYLKRYNALVSVTPTIVDRLKGINPDTFMITNYPIVADVPSDAKSDQSDYICFAGGVSRRYMHEYVINSLQYTKARYLLAGPAPVAYLEKLKTLPSWDKVDYQGVLNHQEVSALYMRAFAGIVLLDYSPNVGYHKGTLGVLKMFEYMLVGIPVIATDFELWKEIIEGNECGVCIDPHNVQAIADAINYYQNHPEIARQHGENGRAAVLQKYNWATQESLLFDLYSNLLQS